MHNNDNNKLDKLKQHIKSVFATEGYSDRLELPPGCGGPSQIVLSIGKMACFDGCEGLISYCPDHITLSLSDGIVTVYGQDLTMKTFSKDHLAVCGDIVGVLSGTYREALSLEDH